MDLQQERRRKIASPDFVSYGCHSTLVNCTGGGSQRRPSGRIPLTTFRHRYSVWLTVGMQQGRGLIYRLALPVPGKRDMG